MKVKPAPKVKLCKNGMHVMVAENTYVRPANGWRLCRTCLRAAHMRWRAAHREHVRAFTRRYFVAHRAAWARYARKSWEKKLRQAYETGYAQGLKAARRIQ